MWRGSVLSEVTPSIDSVPEWPVPLDRWLGKRKLYDGGTMGEGLPVRKGFVGLIASE